MQQHFAIVGTGLYLPRRKLTAEEIDQRAGLASGWTRTHTGVLVRHECEPPETLASMAQEAIGAAMQDARVNWSDIDLILDGSTSRHQPIPCNAAYLQSCVGVPAQGIPCMDIQTTCLGFILGVHVANALFATGIYRHILITCSEAALMAVDWQQPESACLMGDGAAAVILSRAEATPTYFFAHETYGQYLEACQMRGGCHRLPPNLFTSENEVDFRFHMDGTQLMRAASKHLPPLTDRLLKHASLSPPDVNVFPHQAAPKALELMRRLLGFPVERFHNRVAQMGNLVAAGIPAVLHQCRCEGNAKTNEMIMFLGTSAGYSQAGLICRL